MNLTIQELIVGVKYVELPALALIFGYLIEGFLHDS